MFKNFTGFNLVEQMHRLRHAKRFNPLKLKRKSIGLLFVLAVFLLLWFLPTESFGLDGLTQIQQRIIAIFVYATLMWVMELVPAWATSVSIIVLLLLFTSDSGVKKIPKNEGNRKPRGAPEFGEGLRRPLGNAAGCEGGEGADVHRAVQACPLHGCSL